jgi:hypothetical protein
LDFDHSHNIINTFLATNIKFQVGTSSSVHHFVSKRYK